MVPNALLEKLAREPELGARARVMAAVLLATLGERSPVGELSGRLLAYKTGLTRRAVDDALACLVSTGVLIVLRAPAGRRPGLYRVAGDMPPAIQKFAGTPSARNGKFAGSVAGSMVPSNGLLRAHRLPTDLEEDLERFSTGAGEDEILR